MKVIFLFPCDFNKKVCRNIALTSKQVALCNEKGLSVVPVLLSVNNNILVFSVLSLFQLTGSCSQSDCMLSECYKMAVSCKRVKQVSGEEANIYQSRKYFDIFLRSWRTKPRGERRWILPLRLTDGEKYDSSCTKIKLDIKSDLEMTFSFWLPL